MEKFNVYFKKASIFDKNAYFSMRFYSAYSTNINEKVFQSDISFSQKSLKSKKCYAKMYLNKSAKAAIAKFINNF